MLSHEHRTPNTEHRTPNTDLQPLTVADGASGDDAPRLRGAIRMTFRHCFAFSTVLALAGCANAPAPQAVPLLDNARSPVAGVLVTGRIAPGDIESLRDAGIRRVVDLTPDAETPDFDEASAVRAAGLGYANLPLGGPGDLTRDNVAAFDALMRDATQPVLVHCASGNRVGAMAALRAAWIEGRSAEHAVAIGKAWGLTGLEDEVRRRIASGGAP
jgi:uncharacterized protein (TIGR01244 family)